MVDSIHHAEHQRVIDLDSHPVKEVTQTQIPGILQHGLKLQGNNLRLGEFGVRDDADIRVFLHHQQQILEGEGGIFFLDGFGEEFLQGGDGGLSDPILPAGAPVVAQHDLLVAGQPQVHLEDPYTLGILLQKALPAVEGGLPTGRAHAVGDHLRTGEDFRRCQLAGRGGFFDDDGRGRLQPGGHDFLLRCRSGRVLHVGRKGRRAGPLLPAQQ